jgi:hypothetical protein
MKLVEELEKDPSISILAKFNLALLAPFKTNLMDVLPWLEWAPP